MIDANNVLQVDGTVIAGVLILLTIKSVMLGTATMRKNAGFVAIPFALSAICILANGINPTAFIFNGIDILIDFSIVFTILGFVYLVLFLKLITKI